MKRPDWFLSGFISIFALLSGNSAMGGGLYLNEFSTPSMGTAGAGAQAWANDASTSFHNPAGMTRLDGNQLMLGGGFLAVDLEFAPSPKTPIKGNDGGNAGGPGPILGAYGTYSVSDDLKLGMNIISISAAILDYDDGWAGRYLVDDVTVVTVNFNPTVAYRVNDWLSLGAGMQVMLGTLKENISVPPPEGTGNADIDVNGVGLGFNFGLLLEPWEHTRIGITYVSKIDPDLSGDVNLNPPDANVGIDTSIPFPQVVRVGFYHDLTDRIALLSTLGWEDWSTMDNLILSAARGSQVIPRNWHDTWHVSLGMHYKLTPQWLLQTGFTYDSSPVDAVDRTPDMPMDRQIRAAIGAQYQARDDLNIGGSFVYANYGDAPIVNPLLIGEYSTNNIFFFSLNANWKF